MDVQAPAPPQYPRKCGLPALRFNTLLLGCVLAVTTMVFGQSVAPRHAETRPEAETELLHRIAAAQSARKSGNAAAVEVANQRLAALALREMAQLRLVEWAYPQAIELYQRSLDFEDQADTHIDLAITFLQANEFDKSLSESAKALALKPDSFRAQIVRGKTLMSKGDYAEAAKVLAPIVESNPNPDIETVYSLGICYLQSKQGPDKVQHAFDEMSRLAGDSGSIHVLFGRAYRDAGDLPSAIREFQRAIAVDGKTPHAHYFLGLASLASNEWKVTPEVKEEFSKELANNPHDYLANYMLGFVLSSEHQYETSDKYLEEATKVNSDWPDPWLYLGINAYATEDKPRAEQAFRKAIELTGKEESRNNYQIRRAYIDLGRILVSSGRQQEGEVYLGKARNLQNEVLRQGQQSMSEMAAKSGTTDAAGFVALSAKQETEAAPLVSTNVDPFGRVDAAIVARSHLTAKQHEAADDQENHLRAVLGLAFNDMATSEAVLGEYLAALGHYQEAERWDPKISGLQRNLGLSAFRADNYPEAIRGFSRALQENPNDNPVRAMLGMAYFGAEKYSDAVATFKPLGTRGMQDATVGYAWASSLMHLSQLQEASAVLQEFEKPERTDETRLLIGQLWIEIADYGRAVNAFHRALQSNPTLLKAHYFAGQANIHLEHWAEAAEEFQDELKLNPQDWDAKYNLGFVDLQRSRVDDALAIFQQVVSAEPEHARAQYQIGKILLDRGQFDEAVNHLEIATRLSPGSDYMHYQLQAAYRKLSRIADADRELAVYKEIKEKQRGLFTSGMGSAQSQ